MPLKEDEQIKRKRRLLFMAIGGAVSLLLPLIGVLYIWMSGGFFNGPSAAGSAFDKKAASSEASAPPPLSAQTPNSSQPGNFLNFVKSGGLQAESAQPQTPAPPRPTTTAPPAVKPPSVPSVQSIIAKAQNASSKPASNSSQSFFMPRLKPTTGFSDFSSGQSLQQSAPGQTAQPSQPSIPPNIANLIQQAQQGAPPSQAGAVSKFPSPNAYSIPSLNGTQGGGQQQTPLPGGN